jgi:hypothetical protein
MLNDLVAIERRMAALGIDVANRHPDIKDMAKGWALRVRLKAEGQIAGVELVPEAGRGTLWTLRDGQHNGFPGLKTAAGLLSLDAPARIAHQKAWDFDKTSMGRRTEILRLLATYSIDASQVSTWPSAGHRKRIAGRLAALHALADNPLTAAVPATFERFLLALNTSPPFLESLTRIIADYVCNRGDEWIEPACAVLIGPIALAIDIAQQDFPRDVGDRRQIEFVSAALSGAIGTTDGTKDAFRQCALSGKSVKLHAGNFPQPNLPGLGQTYIFSRNKDIPSLTRYGRTADASFPIDSDLVRRLSGVITSLTREEAKGRSWRLIPAETGDKPDLLVTSVAANPDARLASAVVDDDDDDEASGESAWDEIGARVIAQSGGVYEHGTPEETVVILVLRTVDPANRKTIYHRNTTAAQVWQAAKLWRAATSNTPDWLGFRIPIKGKSELVFRKPTYVAPLSIVPLSRVQFANGGRRRISVIGITAASAFGLFLQEGAVEQRARSLLGLLLQRHGSLLAGLAEARFKGSDHLKDFDPKIDLRRDALRSTAWVGALLHQLGRFKLKDLDMSDHIPYSDDLAFRLGQLLSAADLIHVGYCADLRGGNVPPTLLGNSVLTIAGANPTRALAILQNRLKPYLGWAKRADLIYAKAAAEEGQGHKSRAIALRQGVSQARRSDEIATEVRSMLAPYYAKGKKPDDVFKAELLLGYMAGLPPVGKKAVGDSPTISDAISYDRDEGELG